MDSWLLNCCGILGILILLVVPSVVVEMVVVEVVVEQPVFPLALVVRIVWLQ